MMKYWWSICYYGTTTVIQEKNKTEWSVLFIQLGMMWKKGRLRNEEIARVEPERAREAKEAGDVY